MIKFFFLVSRQGKVRLAKWYSTFTLKERQALLKDVGPLVLARKGKLCNFIEYKDFKIVYKRLHQVLDSMINTHCRYASLYFIAGIDEDENELLALEVIHRYVEALDRYFGNVCELDLIFNFHKANYILDEYLMAGQVQEPSLKAVLKAVTDADEQVTEEAEDRSRLF